LVKLFLVKSLPGFDNWGLEKMIDFNDVKVLASDVDGTFYSPEGIRKGVHWLYNAISSASPCMASFLRECLPRASIPLHYFVVTDGYESVAFRKLRELGALPHIDGLICYDQFNRAKDGEYFLELMNHTGLPAQSHVAVGDNLRTDILPAKSLGMQTIKIGSNPTGTEDLWVPQFHGLERYFELAKVV